MLVLYLAPASSSMAPHIALHEIGAPFEARQISFAKKEQREPAFLAINPHGRVPTLVADGRVLTEVAAILYFLARKFPDAKLWPDDDLAAQAESISWMSFLASAVHPARRLGLEYASRVWTVAEQKLAGRDWAAGGRYGVADIHLFRLYWRMRASLAPDTEAFPGLEAHYARMMERAAVRRTIEVERAMGYETPA